MIKTTLLSITAAMALATAANASIVTMSAGLFGPFAFESDGVTPVNGGLMRLGHIPDGADLGDGSIGAIDMVFEEFGTSNTSATGGLGDTISNGDASDFDGKQIYLWVFNTPDYQENAEHGVYSVQDADAPTAGEPWRYPTHTGSGTDKVTISLSSLVNGGGLFIPTEATARGGNIILAVPEPSGALLAGLAGMLLVFRRRR